MKDRKPFWGFLERRPRWFPTWRGWLALGLALTLLLALAVRNAYAFLAVNDPVSGGALVVEGWQPDYALEAAIAEFKRHPYEKLYVTGGPIDRGAPLSEYKTYARLGAAILIRLGLDPEAVQAIPAPWVRQDRTYTSAVALRDWLREHRLAPKSFHLLTLGPHARRSRLLFEEALGDGAKVGITAIEGRDYDPNEWWRSSQGFREVTGELIAYAYARLVFRPAPAPTTGSSRRAVDLEPTNPAGPRSGGATQCPQPQPLPQHSECNSSAAGTRPSSSVLLTKSLTVWWT